MNLQDEIKKQMDSYNRIYKVAFEAGILEGRRQVWKEVKEDLKKIAPEKTPCPSV